MFDAVLNGMTQTQADDFDAIGHLDQHAENAAVKLDRTHLNDRGKKVFGRIVADQLARTRVEVGPDVVGVAAVEPPLNESSSTIAPEEATPRKVAAKEDHSAFKRQIQSLP